MRRRPNTNTQSNIKLYRVKTGTHFQIPFHISAIHAGFPSPAEDYISAPIDLNTELIVHPSTTFMGRVQGDSMRDAGIMDGDLLIIDKSLRPKTGDVAVCFIDGEFTIKYIHIQTDRILLVPANPDYPQIRITPENEFMIWGIVTFSIRRHRESLR